MSTQLKSPSFKCNDGEIKSHRLCLDGGLKVGTYELFLCDKCYSREGRRFLIRRGNFVTWLLLNKYLKNEKFGPETLASLTQTLNDTKPNPGGFGL